MSYLRSMRASRKVNRSRSFQDEPNPTKIDRAQNTLKQIFAFFRRSWSCRNLALSTCINYIRQNRGSTKYHVEISCMIFFTSHWNFVQIKNLFLFLISFWVMDVSFIESQNDTTLTCLDIELISHLVYIPELSSNVVLTLELCKS